MASAYYWTAKEPAVEWFTAVPFGMNAEGMAAWYYQGDGLKLWEETYTPFNLVPRPATAASPQMAGWFRRKINTISDHRAPWPGESTRRSRSSRRWWAPGTTSPKAPTISSSRCEVK
jgi:hypothetical protein